MDYLYYILAVLIIGLVAINAVRFATRSQNPDLLAQYEARKSAARKLANERSKARKSAAASQPVREVKSLRQRHQDKLQQPTPWGWPGAQSQHSQQQGISEAVRNFTNRLVRQKKLAGSDPPTGSIRALLEDRYGPVDKGMTAIPYEKVKRPLLRVPSEPLDQLDNLGSAEARQLQKKLQFLSAVNIDEAEEDGARGTRKSKKVEFRYVELKDLKQPWGW